MIEYKLIKEYPDSSPINTIFKEYSNGADGYLYNNENLDVAISKYNIKKYAGYFKGVDKPQPIHQFFGNSVTRYRDKSYFNKGARIKTPFSGVCFIYSIEKINGIVECSNTHSYLMSSNNMDWLDVCEICEYASSDMINFAEFCSTKQNFETKDLFKKWKIGK